MYWIKQITLAWDDELSNYETIKNICDSTDKRQELEHLESEVRRLTEQITEKWHKDDLLNLKCYLTQKIEHIIYWID